jgi:hypothetical protein
LRTRADLLIKPATPMPGATGGGVGCHDQAFGARAGEFDTETRRNSDHDVGREA